MTTADAAESSALGPSASASGKAYPGAGGSSRATRSVLRKPWTEDLLEKGALVLCAFLGLFSLIALIVLASNKHGDWQHFDRYQEYWYLLSVTVIAFVYSMAQVLTQMRRTAGLVPTQYSSIADFAGDQVMAYLLISALSAAIPITNHMRAKIDTTQGENICAPPATLDF